MSNQKIGLGHLLLMLDCISWSREISSKTRLSIKKRIYDCLDQRQITIDSAFYDEIIESIDDSMKNDK